MVKRLHAGRVAVVDLLQLAYQGQDLGVAAIGLAAGCCLHGFGLQRRLFVSG